MKPVLVRVNRQPLAAPAWLPVAKKIRRCVATTDPLTLSLSKGPYRGKLILVPDSALRVTASVKSM